MKDKKIMDVMRNMSLLFVAILSIVLSCNTKTESVSDAKYVSSPFTGNWISRTYLDSLNRYGTPAKVKNADLEELIINFSADSLCLNVEGVENPVFKIVDLNEKSFRIKKFNQDDVTEFTLSANEKELSYVYKKLSRKIRFFKAEKKYAVKNSNGWLTAAQLYFNEHVLAANYYLLNSEGKRSSDVAFTSYGKVTGLAGYTDYSICYQGDCRSMTDGDLMTLSDKTASDNFIYEWKNDSLAFYSVTNVARSNEMPQYIKGKEIFKLMKRM